MAAFTPSDCACLGVNTSDNGRFNVVLCARHALCNVARTFAIVHAHTRRRFSSVACPDSGHGKAELTWYSKSSAHKNIPSWTLVVLGMGHVPGRRLAQVLMLFRGFVESLRWHSWARSHGLTLYGVHKPPALIHLLDIAPRVHWDVSSAFDQCLVRM